MKLLLEVAPLFLVIQIQIQAVCTKSQLILKGLFGILEFFQKTNERISFSIVRGKKRMRYQKAFRN